MYTQRMKTNAKPKVYIKRFKTTMKYAYCKTVSNQ